MAEATNFADLSLANRENAPAVLRGALPSRDRLTEAMLHWDVEFADGPDEAVLVRIRTIGEIHIAKIGGPGCRGRRTDNHRTLDGADYVSISCKLEGSGRHISGHREMAITAGDVMVWRNIGDMGFVTEGWSRELIIRFPESLFRSSLGRDLPEPHWHLSSNTSLGPMIASSIATFAACVDDLDDRSARAAVGMIMSMVRSVVESEAETRSSMRTTLYRRISQYIENHVEDGDLTPAKIAEAHAISIRYLHMIFSRSGQSVSGFVREQRLQQCRQEIETRARGMTLADISHHWSFSDVPHLSRSFKERFGMTPRECRRSYDRRIAGSGETP